MASYFTIPDANAALPRVIELYKAALKCRAEVMRAEQRLAASQVSETPLESYCILKRELNSRLVKYYESIETLEATGVAVKSLDEGLLDFPAKRFDSEIWLCWKDGETEIKFWHEKDEGFMGRKPLEVSDESLV